jgi:hypothetical protein
MGQAGPAERGGGEVGDGTGLAGAEWGQIREGRGRPLPLPRLLPSPRLFGPFLRRRAKRKRGRLDGGGWASLSHLGGTIAGGSSAASGSIFLPRKAAGDCGQVGGRRRQLTTDQGLAARQPFLRLCQREG